MKIFHLHSGAFQYISCYSLSRKKIGLDWYGLLFQYISCYSLSSIGDKIDLKQTKVSIHLMLLFILLASWGIVEWVSFNTSHVTLYQHPSGSMTMARYVSIHLMLLFIEIMEHRETAKNCVSIHLMLLFIWYRMQGHLFPNSRFNTSHVTLYRLSDCQNNQLHIRFNTSHVTLYRIRTWLINRSGISFQYISCYSLSRIAGSISK